VPGAWCLEAFDSAAPQGPDEAVEHATDRVRLLQRASRSQEAASLSCCEPVLQFVHLAAGHEKEANLVRTSPAPRRLSDVRTHRIAGSDELHAGSPSVEAIPSVDEGANSISEGNRAPVDLKPLKSPRRHIRPNCCRFSNSPHRQRSESPPLGTRHQALGTQKEHQQ
jgi:hypothetical protein